MKYVILICCASLSFTGCGMSHGSGHENHASDNSTSKVAEGAFSTALPSIPEMSGSTRVLTAQTVRHDAGSATFEALGYSGSGILGPTLTANTGDVMSLTLQNRLAEGTNLHWHGLTVPPEQDGYPDSTTPPGGTNSYSFPILQRAGLYWYHPHAHGSTAKQAYRGLAGLIRIADSAERGYRLPSGKDEVLLVLQDKRLSGSVLEYAPSSSDVMAGMLGETIFVNGAISPVATLRKGWNRLRVLNGSNARVFNLALGDGTPLLVIGSDGGLLENAQSTGSILLGPGERVDVLVDLSRHAAGTSTFLKSMPFSGGGIQGSQDFRLLKILIDSLVGDSSAPSLSFAPLALPVSTNSVRTRIFEMTAMAHGGGGHSMGGGMGMHQINGKSWDPRRVDDSVVAGRTEIWEFKNPSDEIHPVHIHGMQFGLLERTGGRAALSAHERGWKDTFVLLPGETVRAVIRFPNQPGLFLLHCHNLEHEDDGMMLQFRILP
jgi:blue copper oxidase